MQGLLGKISSISFTLKFPTPVEDGVWGLGVPDKYSFLPVTGTHQQLATRNN